MSVLCHLLLTSFSRIVCVRHRLIVLPVWTHELRSVVGVSLDGERAGLDLSCRPEGEDRDTVPVVFESTSLSLFGARPSLNRRFPLPATGWIASLSSSRRSSCSRDSTSFGMLSLCPPGAPPRRMHSASTTRTPGRSHIPAA